MIYFLRSISSLPLAPNLEDMGVPTWRPMVCSTSPAGATVVTPETRRVGGHDARDVGRVGGGVRPRAVPDGGCVLGTCGARESLYVVERLGAGVRHRRRQVDPRA
jgi:hypothetical protein